MYSNYRTAKLFAHFARHNYPLPPQSDVLVNFQSHVQTSSHVIAVGSRKKQTSLSSFFTGGQKSDWLYGSSTKRVSSIKEDSVICYGMYKDTIQYGSSSYDVRFLCEKDPSIDANNNETLWCIEKQRTIPSFVNSSVSTGTIRSPKCSQVTTNKSYMCFECKRCLG